jgi:hypothetical protein
MHREVQDICMQVSHPSQRRGKQPMRENEVETHMWISCVSNRVFALFDLDGTDEW